MIKPIQKLLDQECQRILEMTDQEVMAEHLKIYDGNQKLAKKSIDMLQGRIQNLMAKYLKQ